MTRNSFDFISHKLPSPVQKLDVSPWVNSTCDIYIKRDDLIHPEISGNKWRKLKYNFIDLPLENPPVIVSFGGAFSNHIHALAAACRILGLPSVGFIRGELDLNNPTLKFCLETGMTLIPVIRSGYRLKENAPEVKSYLSKIPHYVIIPEGGTNEKALIGVREIIDEILLTGIQPDHIVLSAGTGGTSAGLLSHPHLSSQVLAFSSLKSDHLWQKIVSLADGKQKEKLTVNNDYHRGGYGRYDDTLLSFISDFENHTGIALDHVYNGKAMFGLIQLLRHNYFKKNDIILYLHTGGLQGMQGLKYIKSK